MPEALKIGDRVLSSTCKRNGVIVSVHGEMAKVKIPNGRDFIKKCFLVSNLKRA